MKEGCDGREFENGELAQRASGFLVELLVGHPKLKEWFADSREYLEGLKTPEEVFEKLDEIDLNPKQRRVIGQCVAMATPNIESGRKRISPLGLRLRKSLQMHPEYPIPERYK